MDNLNEVRFTLLSTSLYSILQAFDMLRRVLPHLDEGRKLSKFETLQMAQQYIHCLDQILKRP